MLAIPLAYDCAWDGGTSVGKLPPCSAKTDMSCVPATMVMEAINYEDIHYQ